MMPEGDAPHDALTGALAALAREVAASQDALARTGGGSLVAARIALRGVAGSTRQEGASVGIGLGFLPLGLGVQVLHGVETSRGVWLDCEVRPMPAASETEGNGT